MKKALLYIFSATLIGTAASCADLDQTPKSSIDREEFYQSKEDIESAINGIYEEFTEDGFYGIFNNQSIYINDLQSDYCEAGSQTNTVDIHNLSDFLVQPTNIFVHYAWQNHYKGINRANVVIDKVEANNSLDEQTKDNYINEARFVRAVYYFNLVRYFGGVPIVLHDGEGEGAPRASVDSVYHQIVSDFEAAENIPASYNTLDSKGNSTAASAFLSKVYITWAQTSSPEGKAKQKEFYQKAVEYADKVISSGRYSLDSKFIDNWSVDKKKNNPEHIFTIEHDRSINANVTGHCTFATNWQDDEPVLLPTSDVYYREFDSHDQRRDGSYAKKLYNPNTGTDYVFTVPRFRKYIDSLNYANPNSYGNAAGQSTNTTVLRYAEILLIKAEAENELNGPTAAAYDAINQVRRRAYWSPYSNTELQPTDGTPLELSGLTKDEFRQAVRDEYRKEFVLEGQTWFNLIRWHILVSYVKDHTNPAVYGTSNANYSYKYNNVSVKNYLLPIPADQLILNKNLTQNWGYSGETTGSPYDDTFK